MNPLKLFLFFAVILSLSFAIDKTDFKLDHVESDWGQGCQYYTVDSQSLAIDTTIAKPTASVAIGATSNLKNGAWEVLVTKNLSRQVWIPNIKCTANVTGNTTETCVDNGEYKTEYYLSDVWESMGSTYKFPAKVKTQLRYCASYDMKKIWDGWGARIDIIPSFGGFSYPEYAWYNVSWANRKCLDITNTNSTAQYSFNVTLWNNTAYPEMRFTTNASGSEALCTGWWKVENESVSRWILNCSLATGGNEICGYYNNNTVVTDLRNISTACLVGDHFEGSSVDSTKWTIAESPTVSGSTLQLAGASSFEQVRSKLTQNRKAIVEFYSQMGRNGNGIYGGLYNSSLGNYYAFAYQKTAQELLRTGSGTESEVTEPTWGTGYNNHQIIWNTNNATHLVNHTYWNSTGSNVPVVALPVMLAVTTGGSTQNVDWVCSYSDMGTLGYAATISDWGAEESPNAAPTVVSLNLTPTTAYTETDLTAAFTINDTDSEYLNATVYWYKNGVMQPTLNATFINILANSSNSTILGNGNTTQNENWAFAVNATDGLASSSLNFSSNVTILNRVPAISDIAINLPAPYHLVAITCNFTALDNDSDTMTANVTWYNGSTAVSTQSFAGITNGTVTTATLAAGNTTGIGDVWKCGINLSDSYNLTQANSSTVTIANNNPEVQNIAIAPASPYDNDPLNCSFTAYDADADLITATFRWYKNGAINNSLNTTQTSIPSGTYVSALLAAGNTSINDKWNCNVSITDSFATVSDITSNVTILNHVPEISGKSFLPVLAYDTDNLTCSFTALDQDLHSLNVTFRFFKNDVINNSLNKTYTGLTNGSVQSTILTAGNTTTGDNWICQISLNDPYNTTTENTTSVTVTTTSVNLTSPTNGTTLYGSPTFTYSVVTSEPVTCNLSTSGVLKDTHNFAASGSTTVPVSLSSGSYNWYVNCSVDSNPALTFNSATWVITVTMPSLTTLLNLSSSPENILSSPQAIYYDIDDYLNILYFQDGATNTFHLYTINNAAVEENYSATLNATKQFFVALREPAGETWILTFNEAGTQKNWIKFSPGNPATVSTTTTAYGNTTNNINADPYTYADTKHFDTLSLDSSSYYLVMFGTTNKTRLGRINVSSEDIISVANTTNNRTVVWQTHAASSDLKNWYYAWPRYLSGTYDYISIYTYNGATSTLNATPAGSNYYTKAQIEGAKVYFESYNNKTYFVQANTSTHAVIYLIEEAKTYQINYTVSDPSHFLFIDEYTFVFFSNESGTNYAYSCYFATSPNCTRMTSAQYGASVPYMRGQMITANRENTSDTITKGAIYSTNTSVTLAYDQYIYDVKFKCYDEMDEVRYPFTTQIFATNSSQILTSSVWGYVLQSDLLGAGVKRSYGLCTGGTTRLRVVGLNNAFALNLYSLNTTDGQYYDFHVTDQYNQPISNVTITAMRYSPVFEQYVTIEQGITDFTGTATLFLEPYILYQFTVSADGYVPLAFEFVPATTTSITIVLSTSSGTFVNLPTFNRVFNDVSYSIMPNNVSFAPPNLNLTYQIASTNATLEYYGMTVTKKYNGTLTTVFNQNVTTQPAGGILNYTTNGTGQYTVTVWFKAQNYSLFYPTHRIYYIGNATGLAAARQELIDEAPISGWLYYLIAVVAAMLVAGFVSNYTIEGAGIVGLFVLWGFTWLYPSALVVPELGITTFLATCLTTLMVAAGVYIMRQGV